MKHSNHKCLPKTVLERGINDYYMHLYTCTVQYLFAANDRVSIPGTSQEDVQMMSYTKAQE